MEDKIVKSERATSETIAYGMELKSEFANDPRREVKRALEDTFALIAYADARESSLAPLLEISGRAPVAEELNSAILGTFVIQRRRRSPNNLSWVSFALKTYANKSQSL